MQQVTRQGREIRVTCEDATQARRLARGLDADALRTLTVVGAAAEEGEAAEFHVIWKEGGPWLPGEAA